MNCHYLLKFRGNCWEAEKLQYYSDFSNTNSNSIDLVSHHEKFTSNMMCDGAVFTCAGLSFVLLWEESAFVSDRNSWIDEGCHVQNGQAFLLESGPEIACNGFFMQLYRIIFKSNAVNQYSNQYFKIILSEVDFYFESNSRKSVCISKWKWGK